MLTENKLREILASGQRISDEDFIEHSKENMARTVFLMVCCLADPQHTCLNSRELTDYIESHLQAAGVKPNGKRFNPVDWFSSEWTRSGKGQSAPHFMDEYRELFQREDKSLINYRMNGDLREMATRILSELRTSDLTALADELNNEGAFTPTNEDDARRRTLRAIAIRQGQQQFRARLLEAYNRRCAVTGCDATPALEAAHITPYGGAATNTVSNGILLRADIHTLFDLDHIGIDPQDFNVRVSWQLRTTEFKDLDGRRLRIPNNPSAKPDRAALELRWKSFIRTKKVQ